MIKLIKKVKKLFTPRLPVNHWQVQELVVQSSQRLYNEKAIAAYNEMLTIKKAVEGLKLAQELTGQDTLHLTSAMNGETAKSFTVQDNGQLLVIDHNKTTEL